MAQLSPMDRDLMIRTVLSEAGDQPFEGKTAVAHSILNRLNAGRYGNNVSSIVLAPNQYEPWGLPQNAKNNPLRFDPNSKAYQQAGALVDDVSQGYVPDPTNGATHFLQENIVRKRRGGSLPPWASGQGQKIGDHTFYKPEGSGIDAINGAIGNGSSPRNGQALGFSMDNGGATGGFQPGSIFKLFDTKQQAAGSNAPDTFEPGSIFKQFNVQPQGPAPAETKTSAASDGGNAAKVMEQTHITPPSLMTPAQKAEQEAALKRGQENDNISERITRAAGEYHPIQAIGEQFSSSKGMFKKGWEDLSQSKSATGVGEVGLGALGMAASPLTGPLSEATRFGGNVIGNPEAAERAMMVAPVGKISTAVKAATPSARALTGISGMIPEHYLGETISALERNPNLTLMDVSKSARSMGKGIAVDPLAPQAQNEIAQFVTRRGMAEKQTITQAAEKLGTLPQPLAVLDGIKQQAIDVGKKVIEPVVASAKPADITSIIKKIDSEIGVKKGLEFSDYQKALSGLRDQLRGTWKDRDAMFADVNGEQGLHAVQANLRAESDNLLHSVVGSERTLGYKMMQVRNKLVDVIDKSTGGTYKPALAKYRDAKQVHDAFDRGLSFERARKGELGITEDSSEAWGRWAKDASPEELAAARLGALSSIKDKLNSIRTARSAADIPTVDRNIEKLELLFGKDKAKNFSDYMHDVRRTTRTNRELEGGSDTAERLLGAQASPIRVPGKTPNTGISTMLPLLAGATFEALQPGASAIGAATSMGLAGLHGVRHLVQRHQFNADLARRLQEAKLLTSSGENLSPLIALLRQRQIGVGNKGLNALASPLLQAMPR